MDTVIRSWCSSELTRKLPSRAHLRHLMSAMLRLRLQGWKQKSLILSSGMSGPQEIQHQGAPNMGCVSQGSKRRQLALDGAEVGSIWVCGCGWVWPGWYSQGHGAVQASDPPRSTAKEVAGPTPVMRDPRTTSALYDWALVITTSQMLQDIYALFQCRTSWVLAMVSVFLRLAGGLFLAHYHWAQSWNHAEIHDLDSHCPGNREP